MVAKELAISYLVLRRFPVAVATAIVAVLFGANVWQTICLAIVVLYLGEIITWCLRYTALAGLTWQAWRNAPPADHVVMAEKPEPKPTKTRKTKNGN